MGKNVQSSGFKALARGLKIFFFLLYHQFAWGYDWVAAVVSLGKWNQWVLTALPYLRGPRVLELGHGPGHLQVAMLARGLQAVGLDQSRQMGALARRTIHKGTSKTAPNGYAQSPKLVRATGQALPFPMHAFHSIVATFPTPYIFEASTLAEVQRLLVPGGRLIVLLSATVTGQTAAQRAAGFLFRVTGQAGDPPDEALLPFTQAGLAAEIHWIKANAGQILMILAVKPAQDQASNGNVG